MWLDEIKKIGQRMQREIADHLHVLLAGESFGPGAGGDITHCIDRRAEDIILEELIKLDAPVTLVSEECGIREINGGGPILLVDPIDGSRNAISGIPLFSCSIALIEGKCMSDIQAGYVVDIISGDEYWAVSGGGSFCNGQNIRVQQENAFMIAGYETQVPGKDLPRIMPLISMFNRVRCFGSTALDLAFLAKGSLSLFVMPSPSRSFDFAAGYLLVKEAGGIVTDLEGNSIKDTEIGVKRSVSLLVTASPEMHRRALDALNLPSE